MKQPKIEYKPLDTKTGLPLRIIADGAIGSRGIFGGRLIPVVIVDTSGRPDVEELVRIHYATASPGDSVVQWGQIENREETVVLWLKFIRPAEVSLAIEFRVIGQGILVDQALNGKGIYIQPGREGDRLKYDPNRPKIFIEIGDTGYKDIWETTFKAQLTKHFRTKGLGRSESRRAAAEALEQMRAVTSFRMRESAN
jgi:hypothetical protein